MQTLNNQSQNLHGEAAFPVVPGNAGHPLDKAPLPFWLDRPCPSWCDFQDGHQTIDGPDDREHLGGSDEPVVLTLQDAITQPLGDGDLLVAIEEFRAYLQQGYRERGPRVHLAIGAEAATAGAAALWQCDLTLAEAAELAADLADLAGIGAKAEESAGAGPRAFWQERPCPVWCAAAHADENSPGQRWCDGGWRSVTMILEKPVRESGVANPRRLRLRLNQDPREREPHIAIDCEDDLAADLTLAEAGKVADRLSDLVRTAGPDALAAG